MSAAMPGGGVPIGALLPEIAPWFKSMITNAYIRGVKQYGWPRFDDKLWQCNYWKHIVCNENELNKMREYISKNPSPWAFDRETLDATTSTGAGLQPVYTNNGLFREGSKMKKWQPYSAYKPSGVDWLGDVPAHWEVKRLKFLATINDETLSETTSPDFEFTYVDIGSVDPVKGIFAVEDKIFETAPSRARRIVRKGDTIVSTVRTYLRAIAPIRTQQSNLIVSTGFAVVRPHATDQGFMSYAMCESGFIDSIVARSVGVSYPATNASEIGTIPIPLPNVNEQTVIADFLDHKTGKIDSLIEKKQVMIERLKEKRIALISRTVTCGLPPDEARKAGLEPHPKLKPSGIDWLGDVPAHWEVKRLNRLTTSIRNGTSAPQVDKADNTVPVTRIESISSGKIDFSKVGYIEWSISVESYRLNRGDILLSHINSLPMVGNCALFDSENILYSGMNLLRIQPKAEVHASWLWRVISSFGIRKEISARAKPAINQASITTTQIKTLQLPVPPLAEQTAIADFLDRETAKIDKLIAKIETAIERLREYRTAIITAAVTGKIDVRGCYADSLLSEFVTA